MVGTLYSPIRIVYADVTLTRSKVEVKVTGLLNFRQLAKPCMLAAMTAASLRGFQVSLLFLFIEINKLNSKQNLLLWMCSVLTAILHFAK